MNRGKKNPFDPAIHRIPLGKLTIYEITEAELESLERGSPESLYLNLCILSVSTAISFAIALATTEIEAIQTFCVFVIITVVCALSTLTFGLLWKQSRGTLKTVSQEIRSRSIPEGIQEKPILPDDGIAPPSA